MQSKHTLHCAITQAPAGTPWLCFQGKSGMEGTNDGQMGLNLGPGSNRGLAGGCAG